MSENPNRTQEFVAAFAAATKEQLPDKPPRNHVPRVKLRRSRTIRNRGHRIGRNDPCPCGSGKKYKLCHLGKLQIVT
jgi:uncharacterized protein YecA (UPF0149 family)